jgi:predicted deacylase
MPIRLNRAVILLLAVARFAFAQPAWSADAQAAGVVAAGTPAATPFYVCDSGVSGPTVVITAGIHGDEPAGSVAADQIRNWPITRGKMVVLPRANVVALNAGKRLTPGAEPAEDNLNRNFPSAADEAARGALASNLWAFVATQRPDWLVDLHEGSDFNRQTNSSVGSSVIAGASPVARAEAVALQAAVNATVTNAARHFTLLGPPVAGSLARAAGDRLGAHALIAETTTKGQPLSLRVRQHRILAHALLSRLGMIDARVMPEWMTPSGKEAGAALRVAVYDDGGTGGVGGRRVEEQARQSLGACVCRVCGDDIRGGALEGFDVVVFPGGSGSREAASLGEAGRERVRAFVEQGGGYIGICAGAYLALCNFSWGLRILDAKTVSPLWRRGVAEVKLELTEPGRRILGGREGLFDCHYANGPCITPANVAALPDYETLAWFRSEVAEHGAPAGVMSNSPAIVAGRYGKGRVLCSSPHPEQTAGLEAFLPRAVAWASGRQAGEGGIVGKR